MRRKLPLLVSALLFVAVGAFSLLAYRQLATALIAAAEVRVTSVANRLAQAFAESETRARTDKRRPHADSAFVAFLANRDAASERRARAALESYRGTDDKIATVELWTRTGERVLDVPSPGFQAAQLDPAPVVDGFASRSLIGPFVAHGDTVYMEVRYPVIRAGHDTVAFARSFHRLEDANSGALVRNLIGTDAVMLIGNTRGDVWTDMSRRLPAPPATHASRSSTRAAAASSADGSHWIGATSALPLLPWTVWVALPRDTVLAPAREMLRFLAALAAAIVAIGAFVAWLVARRLTRPLAEVIEAADSIASGDYSRRLSVHRQDEVGRLATAFNTMTSQVQVATHDLEAQQMELEVGNQELADAVERADRVAAELQAIVDGSPLGICTLDLRGVVMSWNPAAERIFGWSAAEVVGEFKPTVIPDDRVQFDDYRTRLLAGERIVGQHAMRLHKDGHLIPVSLSATALCDSAGTPVGMLAMFEDVTDATRMQEQLASERRFLRQVIDINPSFVYTKDREGRFTLVNQASADVYGSTIADMIGKSDADFNDNADEVEGFRRADLEVLDGGVMRIIPEERITDATGNTRWLHTVKRPLIDEDGRATQLLGVSTDITARKMLEAQLLQSQKMDAVGQLAGGVAHDFNNVLTAIKGFSELAALQVESGHPVLSDIAEIGAAADRAAALTQQLLAFSRRQLLVPVVLSPNAVVEGISKLLARLIGAEVQCETRLAPDLGVVRADLGQIEQVLVNLAVNARDAMPNGGTLTIETANATLDAEHAELLSSVEVVVPGRYVMLSVTDTGIGMSRETQASIFEPFFTTKEPGKGTGLGLSTVYGIVRQSGGYVHVYSELGHGSSFKVFLPCVDEALGAASTNVTPPAPSDVSETILVVDDDAGVRSTTARMLARAGYSVLSAASPLEAQALWTQHPGPIHLLMTDVMMPEMDGGALARLLLRTRPNARVLFTSGYTNDAVIGRGLITADTVFLPKPFTIDAVVKKAREALAGPPAEQR